MSIKLFKYFQKEWLLKVLKVVDRFVLVILIVTALFSAIAAVTAEYDKNKTPGIGNFRFLAVLSNSMNPVFKTYDMIIDRKESPSLIKIGDIITYQQEGSIVTHRVSEITHENGEILFKTKGDANNVSDENLVNSGQIVGKYVFRISYAGYIIYLLKGTFGMILIWLLLAYLLVSVAIERTKVVRRENI